MKETDVFLKSLRRASYLSPTVPCVSMTSMGVSWTVVRVGEKRRGGVCWLRWRD